MFNNSAIMLHSCASINNIQLLQIKSTPLRCTFAYIHSILLFYHKVNKISRLFYILFSISTFKKCAVFSEYKNAQEKSAFFLRVAY